MKFPSLAVTHRNQGHRISHPGDTYWRRAGGRCAWIVRHRDRAPGFRRDGRHRRRSWPGIMILHWIGYRRAGAFPGGYQAGEKWARLHLNGQGITHPGTIV